MRRVRSTKSRWELAHLKKISNNGANANSNLRWHESFDKEINEESFEDFCSQQ